MGPWRNPAIAPCPLKAIIDPIAAANQSTRFVGIGGDTQESEIAFV